MAELIDQLYLLSDEIVLSTHSEKNPKIMSL